MVSSITTHKGLNSKDRNSYFQKKEKLQDDEVDVRIPMVDHTPYYVTAKLY